MGERVVGGHPRGAAGVVRRAEQHWEGSDVDGPSALRVGGEVWLYYGGAGGIGLARSIDGLLFTKTPGPVLAPDPGNAWETSPPRAPSVAVLPDGSWTMFYAAGNAIGEAHSSDGLSWTRVDGDPSSEAR